MVKKYIGILVVLFFFVGCKKDRKTSREVEQIESQDRLDKIQSQIIFKGKSDDSQALNYFNIMNDSYFIGNNHRAIHRDIYKDSAHFVFYTIPSIYGNHCAK